MKSAQLPNHESKSNKSTFWIAFETIIAFLIPAVAGYIYQQYHVWKKQLPPVAEHSIFHSRFSDSRAVPQQDHHSISFQPITNTGKIIIE